jgi:hypothetical protein
VSIQPTKNKGKRATRRTINKKSTITLAIDSDVLKEIRKEAEARGLSVNAKINKILTKYVSYDKYTESLKCIDIANKTFRSFLEDIGEDRIIQEFKANLDDLVPTAFHEMKIDLMLEHLIKFSFENLGLNSGIFHQFSHYKSNEGYTHFVMRHNYGIKWSRILATVYSNHLESIVGYRIAATLFPSSVVLKILQKDIE